jgi:hypothetical protein
MTPHLGTSTHAFAAAGPAAQRPTPLALDLFKRLQAFCGSVTWEPSFKLAAGKVLDGRFLLSFAPPDPGLDTRAFFRFMEELGLPTAYWPACKANLPDACHLHLGAEPGPEGLLLKLYLELFHNPAPTEVGDLLVHLAFKWDSVDPARHALARYYDRSALDAATLKQRVMAICGPAAGVAKQAEALIEQMEDCLPTQDLLLLEALEEGNPRRTFDLCIYPAALRVRDLSNWMETVFDGFAVPRPRRDILLGRFGDALLGHFAGGIARDGGEVCSIFYGAGLLGASPGG